MRSILNLALVACILLLGMVTTVSGSACTSDLQYFDGSSCLDVTNCTGTLARFVRIHQVDRGINHVHDALVSTLNLNELEVYSNGINVARAAATTVSISSTLNASTGVANCFDGSRTADTVCATNTAASDSLNHQFILVDLGSVMPIQSVEIYNYDGDSLSADRLATAELRLEDGAGAIVQTIALTNELHHVIYTSTEFESTAPTASSDRVCSPYTTCTAEQYIATAATNVSDRTCDTLTECNGQVRFVRIQNRLTNGGDNGLINLREVEVWSGGVNIARDSTTTVSMSSTWSASTAVGKCFDGITASGAYEQAICHTNFGNRNWLLVDLGGLRSVDRVEIYNRIDSTGNQARLQYSDLEVEGLNGQLIRRTTLTTAGHQVYDGFTAQISGPVVPGQDRSCTNVTVCDHDTEWTSVVATNETDAQCSNLTVCNSTEFASVTAAWNRNRVCSPITECTAQQYEFAAPTATSDRECRPIQQCGSNQFETAAPTATSDRACQLLTVCQSNEVEIVAPTATSDRQCSTCNCANALTADYKNTLAPDAGKEAYTTIELNTNTWDVEFKIHNVLSMTNGHIIAAPIEARTTVASAISALVSSYNTNELWNPPRCALSALDIPAAGLGVAVDFQGSTSTCYRSFTIKYSLTNPAQRTGHCQLVNTAGNEIRVECKFEMNTIRAYDLTEPTAFLAKETVFFANITMPRTLPNELETLLHASLAKCSVYAAPHYYVDCRIPALWNFGTNFSVTQSPSWIQDHTCHQTNGTDATYIRCDLQSLSQIYTEATAVIAATVLPSGEIMNFNVNYSLPREETATATGALTTFVKSIGTKDGKFFYGNDDLLTLEIEVVDTARLEITDISLFNSDSPIQSYDLRTTPQFETVETQNATFFVITFYPARVLRDANFYLHGPHGVNVSFLFTAARRQGGAPEAGEKGTVTYSGVGIKAPDASSTAGNNAQASGSTATSTTLVAAVAAAALVAVVAVVAGIVVVAKKSKATKPAAPAKEQKESPEVDCSEV